MLVLKFKLERDPYTRLHPLFGSQSLVGFGGSLLCGHTILQ